MRRVLVLAVAAASLIAVIAAPMVAGDGNRTFKTKLSGFNETPKTLSVAGTGTFTARLTNNGQALNVKLNYANLTGPATMAHIHFGAKSLTGGIAIWLCDSAAIPAPAALADCPGAGGQVNVTVGPANVIAIGDQDLPAGQAGWDELVRAMRAGFTYVNIHTGLYPPGEIRGQITRGDDD